MASATGIPSSAAAARGRAEEEPLLGGSGDASQAQGQPLYHNFLIGTAPIAQAGIWILTAIVWGAIFSKNLSLFSAHPLLNSAGFLLAIQAILILQPTHSPEQKRSGTTIHFILHVFGISALTAGLIVIVRNKIATGHEHFTSAHSRLGLALYVFLYLQVLVGYTQYYVPQLYGGVDHAKRMYRYHRVGGYLFTLLGLATLSAATWTSYNVSVTHIRHWTVVTASVLVLVGLVPRIRLVKFGFKRRGSV